MPTTLDLLAHGAQDVRMPVPQDHRAKTQHAVDVAPAVDIIDVRAVGVVDVDGDGPEKPAASRGTWHHLLSHPEALHALRQLGLNVASGRLDERRVICERR